MKKTNNKIRKTIQKDLLSISVPLLTKAGFVRLNRRLLFYRERSHVIDIFEMRMSRPGYNTSYRSGRNSFEIEIGVFFKAAPHPMGAKKKGILGLPVDSVAGCHFRTRSRPNLFLRDGIHSSLWRTKPWKLLKKPVLNDVESKIKTFFLPWFDKFDDLDRVKQYLAQKFNPDEINMEGNKRSAESWGYLYTGSLLQYL